jgi:hypothetical protein
MVNARLRRRAFFIERACFFDTCGAEKIKDVGSAKGFDARGKLVARLMGFEIQGMRAQRFCLGA